MSGRTRTRTRSGAFRPWTNPKATADGPSILEYIRETAEMYGIDRRIRYRHRVVSARRSGEHARWTVEAVDGASGETVRLGCRFPFVCSGYYDVETHFTPRYDPWDQRLCLVPDDDLFRAVGDGSASVVTDPIETFTERGIRLRSGDGPEADPIVTATGLKRKFLGGMAVEVDGRRVEPSETMAYEGTMLGDVSNLAMAAAYTNASWTLKCDLSSRWVCRRLAHMDARGHTVCVPRRNDPSIEERPLLDLQSGCIRRSVDELPRQGSARPWKLFQNCALDRVVLRHAPIEDGVLELS